MIEYKDKAFRELRCETCRALLALEYVVLGRLSIKCPRCKQVNIFNFRSAKSVLKEAQAESVIKKSYGKHRKCKTGSV